MSLQRYSYFVREVGLVDDKVANVMNQLETAIVQFIKADQMLKAYAVSNLIFKFITCDDYDLIH